MSVRNTTDDAAPRAPTLTFHQTAAVPYLYQHGQLHVVLVTSRDAEEWDIPRGNLEPGRTPAQTAEQESLEEAGVIGELDEQPLCEFRLKQRGGTGLVQAFAQHVEDLCSEWAESTMRKRLVLPARIARPMLRVEFAVVFDRLAERVRAAKR